ncbi:MAG: exodeoxyribonuclease V subunit alpha [Victivallales bacterium]|nr:exodeoxyribonuclease V subunit alpha [Victivallales bacterium]
MMLEMDSHDEQNSLQGEACDEMARSLMVRMGCSPEAAQLCGRAVAAQANGDVCLGPLTQDEINALKGMPGIECVAMEETEIEKPFVLSGKMLYTRRNWQYEQNVGRRVKEMADAEAGNPMEVPYDGPFAGMEARQREGVEKMCNHRFALLTGGPGTGKTFTIARAVKLIREQGGDVRLWLAAPTGKAAARVKEAMVKEAEQLGLGDIPNATTIHALLEPNSDLVTFRRNRRNPLPLDWLIVDEASMIDLPLMSKLLDALPEGCRLTLVGDANQLASVEPGRVFGDLCRMSGLPKCVLNVSRRFPQGGEIDNLATTVNEGYGQKALEMLKNPENRLLHYEAIHEKNAFQPELWGGFLEVVKRHLEDFARQDTVRGALEKLNDCRVLCAMRHGPYGVDRLNQFIKSKLGDKTPVPMMIVKNNRALGVNNGDVGVVMPRDDSFNLLNEDKTIRRIPLALLPDREVAFASTIHKAQGSEYEDVVIVLPPTPFLPDTQNLNPLLTREILYTAITRTKNKVFLFGGDSSVIACCEHAIQRRTGLVVPGTSAD